MSTAQDIYDVLIKDPQYEGSHGLTREAIVEQEAKRRARQHANNEKALSMAVQNSAIEKLFTFVDSQFLRKALNDLETKISKIAKTAGNPISQHLAKLDEALKYYHPLSGEDAKEQTEEQIEGWVGNKPIKTPTAKEGGHFLVDYTDPHNNKPEAKSIWDVAEQLNIEKELLRFIVSKVTSSGTPQNIDDMFSEFPNEEALVAYAKALFDNTGQISKAHTTSFNKWSEHKEVNDQNSIIQEARTGQSDTPPPTRLGTEEEIADDPRARLQALKGPQLKTFERLRESVDPDTKKPHYANTDGSIKTYGQLSPTEISHMLNYAKNVADLKGDTKLPTGTERAKELAERREKLTNAFQPDPDEVQTPVTPEPGPIAEDNDDLAKWAEANGIPSAGTMLGGTEVGLDDFINRFIGRYDTGDPPQELTRNELLDKITKLDPIKLDNRLGHFKDGLKIPGTQNREEHWGRYDEPEAVEETPVVDDDSDWMPDEDTSTEEARKKAFAEIPAKARELMPNIPTEFNPAWNMDDIMAFYGDTADELNRLTSEENKEKAIDALLENNPQAAAMKAKIEAELEAGGAAGGVAAGGAGDDDGTPVPFDYGNYKNDRPRKTKKYDERTQESVDDLNDEDRVWKPRALNPSGTLGKEYNPFEKGNDTDIAAEFEKLKSIYLGMHNVRLGGGFSTNKAPQLATGTASSENPAYFRVGADGKFAKDTFNTAQIKAYNELNKNKAIIESYLQLFGNINKGTHNQPWRSPDRIPRNPFEPETEKDDTIPWGTGSTEEGSIWGEDSSSTIPPPGNAMWLDLLDSVHGGTSASPEEASGAAADIGGLPNFHLLPSRFNVAGSYMPSDDNLEEFLGATLKVSDADDVAKNLLTHGNEWRRTFGIPPSFNVDEHFLPAWGQWQQERTAREKIARGGDLPVRLKDLGTHIGDFYDYLMDTDKTTGQTRAEAFVAGTHGSFAPVPRKGEDDPYKPVDETPEESSEEAPAAADEAPAEGVTPAAEDSATVTSDEDEIVPPSRRVAQAVSTLTPDKRKEYIDKLMEYEEKADLNEGNRQMFLDHFTDLEDKDLKAQFITHVIERDRKDRAGKSKADLAAGKKPPEMEEGTRQRLIREYAEAHQEIYDSPVDPRKMQVLEGKSEKELKAVHEQMLDEAHKKGQAKVTSGKRFTANNRIPSSIATPEMQAHLTKDDIRMQVRRLIHHHTAYGEHMDGDAQKLWKERMQEAHKLAAAAGMNLEDEMHKDRTEAEHHGDWGSSGWLERVGEAHHETLTRRQGHREAVSKGSELRRNVNYKPHLVATYDDAGNFQTFMNPRDSQPVDQHELRFDDENHYQFHGLDSDKVRKYQRYLHLKKTSGRELKPGEVPSAFGPPPASTDPELEKLKEEVLDKDGQTLPEYDAIKERLEQVGELPGAKDVFYKRFGKTESGRPGRPVNPDGTEMDVPRFHRDAEDTVGTQGWYHPESESWINPHRYASLMASMENQPGSGRHITQGNQYFGRDAAGKQNPADPKYAFALLTNAKKGKIRKGLAGDQTYYLDNSGAIAHAHDAFEAGHMQEHIQPQTVNDVVHDWYSQQMENQIQANPQAFKNEQGKIRDVTVVDSPPGTQQPPEAPKATVPSPFQNMWLELEALGRDPNSALGRREKKKESGWEQFEREQHQPKFHGRDISRLRHPLSKPARDPLTPQELGQDKFWVPNEQGKGLRGLMSQWPEAKQQAYDYIDKTPGVISWAAKKLLGGETTEDKVIRRIRRGYQVQADTERITREAASRVTLADGTKLSDLYVAPGEQKARNEDYSELKKYLAHRSATHRVQGQQATQDNDKETAKSHDVQDKQYQVLSQTLGQLDAKLPGHWNTINDMYNAHLGNVQQAPTAEASFNQWGNEMEQPSSSGADILQQPQQTPKAQVPSAFGGENQELVGTASEKAQVPSAFPSN